MVTRVKTKTTLKVSIFAVLYSSLFTIDTIILRAIYATTTRAMKSGHSRSRIPLSRWIRTRRSVHLRSRLLHVNMGILLKQGGSESRSECMYPQKCKCTQTAGIDCKYLIWFRFEPISIDWIHCSEVSSRGVLWRSPIEEQPFPPNDIVYGHPHR